MDNMDWKLDHPQTYYNEGGSNSGRPIPPTYSDRSYARPDNQTVRAYEAKPGQTISRPRNEHIRSPEERSGGATTRENAPTSQRQPPRVGLDGANDPPSHRQEGHLTGKPRPGPLPGGKAPDPASGPRTNDVNPTSTGDTHGGDRPTDLSDLKARALATIPKNREANSSTPTKELATANRTGQGTTESSVKGTGERAAASAVASTERKDPSTDIDDLLAEGKAAAEAGKNAPESGTSKPDQAQQRSNHQIANHGAHNGENVKRGRDIEIREPVRTSNGVHRESPGPPELGEIPEDRGHGAVVSSARKSDDRKAGENARVTLGGSGRSGDKDQRELLPSSEGRKTVRREVLDRPSTPPKSASKPDVREYGKESYLRPTRKVSESTPHHTSEEYGRLKETRPVYEGDSRRSSGAGPTSSREIYSRRLSGESERDSGSRKAYSSRLIEIEDDDDHHRRGSGSMLPQEHKESTVRRYVEEQPRDVIPSEDPYWADLHEWLEFTGYHDSIYRKDALRRHKEMMELDLKRAALARESQAAQEERAYMTRGHSVAPREEIALGVSRVSTLPRTVRSASVYDMPPPPLPVREDREVIRSIDRPESGATSVSVRSKPAYVSAPTTYRDEGSARLRYVESPAAHAESGTLKRRYRADDEDTDGRPAEKLVRIDTRGRGIARREDDDEEPVPRPVRTYAETEREERRVREHDSASERRLLNDLVRLRGHDGPQARPKETLQRGREAPASMMAREPSRALTPPPRDPEEAAEPRSRRSDESKGKGTPNDAPSRGEVGYSRDFSPARRPQNEVAVRSSVDQGSSRGDIRDNTSDKPSSNEGRGYYQARGGYGNHPQSYTPRGRGRGRGGGVPYQSRLDMRVYNHNHAYMRQQSGAGDLNLGDGGVRYFIMKSFNHENVERSQSENIWMTQEKNSAVFEEAFSKCRHVILFFSINKSMAFQGYARMESAPGTARPPSWASNLLWKSSGPFHIRWLTIAETRFSRVGHLKNAYNDNQAVLVARDGQEVEERCGRELCALIDEEEDRYR